MWLLIFLELTGIYSDVFDLILKPEDDNYNQGLKRQIRF